jgi:cellobiose-specific phosphotransferase system component IIC
MNIQKITTYTVAALGILGAIFLLIIVWQGDDAIEMSAMQGDFSSITPIILLAQIILAITILITVVFSAKNLASDKEKLKSSLMSIGAFLVVLIAAFIFSSGEETPMQDGAVLSANGARWVEAGIRMFYFLTVIAIASMSYGSIRKLIKK